MRRFVRQLACSRSEPESVSLGTPAHVVSSLRNAMARPCASLARRRLMWRSVLLGAVIASALPVVACRKQPAHVPPPPPAPPPPLSEFCVVPDLAGAQSPAPLLTRAALQLGRVLTHESNQPVGTIVRQSPESGTRVKCGTTVDVWIAVALASPPSPSKPEPPKPEPPRSSGGAPTASARKCQVPRLVGLDLQGAAAMLERLNLRVGRVLYNESTTSRSNVILAQRLDPGLIVPCQTEIAVLVAAPPRKAPAQIRVPSLLGRDRASASQALKAVGLRVGEVVQDHSGRGTGIVLDQSPAPGVPVALGTAVALRIDNLTKPGDRDVPQPAPPVGAGPSGKPMPPVVPDRDPVQTFITQRMQPASAAFFAPSPMQRDEPFEVVLDIAPPTISPEDLAMELSHLAEEKLKAAGLAESNSTESRCHSICTHPGSAANGRQSFRRPSLHDHSEGPARPRGCLWRTRALALDRNAESVWYDQPHGHTQRACHSRRQRDKLQHQQF